MTETQIPKTTVVDLTASREGLSRPERFVLHLADMLAANPNRAELLEVTREVTRDDWFELETLWVYSPSSRWWEKPITIAATRCKTIKRFGYEGESQSRATWKFGGAEVIGTVAGKHEKGKAYSAAEILVSVYGR